MKNTLLLVILSLCMTLSVKGQQTQVSYSITGYVKDTITKEALPGTVVIIKSEGKIITSASTDSK